MRENTHSGRKMMDRTFFCQIEHHDTYSILSLQLNTLNIVVHWLEHKTHAEREDGYQGVKVRYSEGSFW